jgi:hypothetical protein
MRYIFKLDPITKNIIWDRLINFGAATQQHKNVYINYQYLILENRNGVLHIDASNFIDTRWILISLEELFSDEFEIKVKKLMEKFFEYKGSKYYRHGDLLVNEDIHSGKVCYRIDFILGAAEFLKKQ